MLKLMALLGITTGVIGYFIIQTMGKVATGEMARIDIMFKAAGL